MHFLISKGNPKSFKTQNCTGRGATEIVRNLKPCISSGPSQNTADGGACSVWLPGSSCYNIAGYILWVTISN